MSISDHRDTIEQVAQIVVREVGDRIERFPLVEPISMQAAHQYAYALAEAGLLAPAPLRQEWSTADDEIDAHTCCGYEDRAVIEAHAARCGYQIVHRWVSDWIEAEADQ